MEALEPNPIFEYPPNLIGHVRKLYGLDKPGTMDEAIDILESWVKQQDHFLKKDFTRKYLELAIIRSKGSIERSKQLMDRMCTAKTLLPKFFISCNIKEFEVNKIMNWAILPKPTNDFYRVSLQRNIGQEFTPKMLREYWIQISYLLEYACYHDYTLGVMTIYDYREANFMELIKVLDVNELKQALNIYLHSFGLRTKSVHFLTKSKAINVLVSTIKQFAPAKLANRFYVHESLDTLYEHVDRDILPIEYGGKEKPLSELAGNWLDILSTKEFIDYVNVMNKAQTDETLRKSDMINNEYLGLSGTFRSLNVD